MRNLLLPILLTACGTSAELSDTVQVDPQPLLDTFSAVQLEPLVGLVEQPAAVIGGQLDCPVVTTIAAGNDVTHERWEGGCTLADGSVVLGEFERFDGPDAAWIAGRDFRVEQDGELRFGLDGAIEITPTDSLWLVDAAVAMCGTQTWPCSEGVLGLDLAYTIYPAASFPLDYDTTVSGMISTESNTTTLDGAWSVDEALCPIEPTVGMLSIHGGGHHAMTLDGALACDGCAGVQVQGLAAPVLCGLNP
jgi:hypothetical protein